MLRKFALPLSLAGLTATYAGLAHANDPATTTIDRLSFRDVFRTGETVGGELAYHMGPDFEPFARYFAGFVGADHLDALRANVALLPLASRFDRQTVIPNNTRFLAGVEGGVSYRF